MTLSAYSPSTEPGGGLDLGTSGLIAPMDSSPSDTKNQTAVIEYPAQTAGYYSVLILMVVLIVAAILGNVCNMFVISRSSHLRHSLSNFFVMNLCTCDLLAAILVMPIAAVSFGLGEWPLSEVGCSIIGFTTSLFMFVSMTTLSVISMERYYSIRLPMHHAAHMSVCKTLGVILLVWLWDGLLAALPLLGLGSYRFRHHRYLCTFTWQREPWHQVYIGLAATFTFILPGILIVIMYIGIFRIAKQAAMQVRPLPASSIFTTTTSSSSPQFSTRSSGDPLFCQDEPTAAMPLTWHQAVVTIVITTVKVMGATSADADMFSLTSFASAESKPVVNAEREGAEFTGNAPSSGYCYRGDSSLASNGSMFLRANTGRPPQSHLKAVKTLLILLAAYALLWGPFFVLHIHGVIYNRVDDPETTELAALWLGFGSFAVNPFLYGWMNKAIREELVALYKRLFCRWSCCWRGKEEADDELLQGPGDEDFLQFLERTSQAPKPRQARHGHIQKPDSLPEIFEQNIDNSDPF